MKFITKTLTLYKDLCYTTEKNNTTSETEYLWEYKNGVKNNETAPQKDLFLLDGQFKGYASTIIAKDTDTTCTAIETGKYLFLQGLIKDPSIDNHMLIVDAAEELFLESLWLEKKIITDTVYVRFLEEDGKNVFQLFRKIESA